MQLASVSKLLTCSVATYMGHVSIASTQYYLRFIEPIASAASERFATRYGDLVSPTAKEAGR